MTGRATAPSPPRFVPFGQYLLLDRLAVGGMAEVYLAKRFDEHGPSDLLAVKRILPSLAENSDFIRMFLDEARIAAQLVHPGIVRIRELGRIGRSHYLAMDFVWGKDLLHVMRRHKLLGAQLSPSVVAYIGIGMCDALHYAHEKKDRHGEAMGLIHRDVSPQNVLVSFDGIVSLIDFGIAKAQSRTTETQAGVLKGKVGYMSPEQIRGGPVDRRSDLFAVGTCLYELLTLKTLFARENAFDAMENVKYVKAAPIGELRPDLSEDFAAILGRAHTRDPAERWQTAAELGDALRKYLREHDPRFDRVAAVTWMRDAFRKELHSERVRLEAFDQLGRAQVVSVDMPRRNSVTDLQIPGTGDPAPPDWDDDEAETIISDDPIPFVDAPPPEPTTGAAEVYYSSEHTIPDDDDGPLPATSPAPKIESDDDVALAASQIDSAVIQRLLPEEAPGQERSAAAREATARHRTASADIDPPTQTGSGAGKWLTRVFAALILLGAGAAGAWIYGSMASRASIEVRTTPQVGASVLLDGVQRGTAPVRLENVAAGEHEVTIVATGYEVVHREIHVDASTTVMVEVALVEIRGSP